MATVYSVCIADIHGTPENVVLEIPLDAAYIWVVRDLSVFVASATSAQFSAYDDANVTWWQDLADIADFGAFAEWHGRQVFDSEAPVIFIQVTAIGVEEFPPYDVRISGYRLTRP